MTTRKKATKKPLSRPSKAAKRPLKSSASAKSKDAKIAKPLRPAKKAAAKAAKGARVSSRAAASKTARAKTKTKAERSKSSRAATSARASAKRKAALAPKTQNAARARGAVARAAVSRSKERKVVSAAKKKAESVKKGHDRLSAAIEARAAQIAAPAVGESEAGVRELSKVVAAPVALEAAAPSKPVKPAVLEKPAVPNAEEATGPKAAKSAGQRQGFKTGEFIVYPAHGVGQIVAVEEQEVAGFRLELFVITFVKDKMTLRVPTGKVVGVGMRKLAEPEVVMKALDILLGRARIKRTMWSRRAQEYETKINSGDLTAIAEVVRDLYRSEAQPEQSYSERQLYEAALDRLAREVAVVQKLSESEALKAIEAQLQKGQRRGPKVEPEAVVVGAGEPDVEEAA
jgi:CarD family transcriptional regulator